MGEALARPYLAATLVATAMAVTVAHKVVQWRTPERRLRGWRPWTSTPFRWPRSSG